MCITIDDFILHQQYKYLSTIQKASNQLLRLMSGLVDSVSSGRFILRIHYLKCCGVVILWLDYNDTKIR